MYLPDPIERMEACAEACAEAWADEYIKGDMFKCGCGKICKLSDGQPTSSNPHAPPVCMDCFEEWGYLEMKRKSHE